MLTLNNGGHLATITSQQENDSVSSWITEESIFGLYQNLNNSAYSEPNGGWEWVTGELLDYTSYFVMSKTMAETSTMVYIILIQFHYG